MTKKRKNDHSKIPQQGVELKSRPSFLRYATFAIAVINMITLLFLLYYVRDMSITNELNINPNFFEIMEE